MSEWFWVCAVSFTVTGYAIGAIIGSLRRIKERRKNNEKTFAERVKVTVIMHMTKDLVDKFDRLGGASWVMDKIISTITEEPQHTPTPLQ